MKMLRTRVLTALSAGRSTHTAAIKRITAAAIIRIGRNCFPLALFLERSGSSFIPGWVYLPEVLEYLVLLR